MRPPQPAAGGLAWSGARAEEAAGQRSSGNFPIDLWANLGREVRAEHQNNVLLEDFLAFTLLFRVCFCFPVFDTCFCSCHYHRT